MDTSYFIDNPMNVPSIKPIDIDKDIMDYGIYSQYAIKKKASKYFVSKTEFMNKLKSMATRIGEDVYLYKLFGIDKATGINIFHSPNLDSYIVYEFKNSNNDIRLDKNINTYKNGDNIPKYNLVIDKHLGWGIYDLFKDKLPGDREEFLYKYRMKTISLLYDYLNIGGNYFLQFMTICKQCQVEMIYLLSSMFKRVIIIDSSFIFCESFLGNQYIDKKDITPFIHHKFTISNKEESFIPYVIQTYKFYTKLYDLMFADKVDEYIDLAVYSIYKKTMYIADGDTLIFIYKLIIDVLKRVVLDNNILKINSAIKSQEGYFIRDIIHRYNCKSCLEVGMAFGVSAMYILSSSKDITLISIDPFQSTQWNNCGKKLLQLCNLQARHKLMEEKSFIALPKLLDKHKFDFIFIDGWHTFDYTLIDFFYSLELLKDDGIIIIDDALHKGVGKCVKYIETNYPHCRKLVSPSTVACFKKVKKDTRDWNFHVNF